MTSFTTLYYCFYNYTFFRLTSKIIFTGQYYRETPAHQAGKTSFGDPNLPNFGAFATQKYDETAAHLASIDIVGEEFSAPVHAMRPAPEPTSKALTINEVIGSACNKIGGEYFKSDAGAM